MVIPKIYNNDMEELEVARHPEEIIKFKIDFLVSKYDMIRTLIKQKNMLDKILNNQ